MLLGQRKITNLNLYCSTKIFYWHKVCHDGVSKIILKLIDSAILCFQLACAKFLLKKFLHYHKVMLKCTLRVTVWSVQTSSKLSVLYLNSTNHSLMFSWVPNRKWLRCYDLVQSSWFDNVSFFSDVKILYCLSLFCWTCSILYVLWETSQCMPV